MIAPADDHLDKLDFIKIFVAIGLYLRTLYYIQYIAHIVNLIIYFLISRALLLQIEHYIIEIQEDIFQVKRDIKKKGPGAKNYHI